MRDRDFHLADADGLADGPTSAELAAIEVEWPLIEAELELLDAEIVALVTRDKTTALAWRRLRRAQRRVLAMSVLVRVPRGEVAA